MVVTLPMLKNLILDAFESGELQNLDIKVLRGIGRLRKKAKELGLTDYRDLGYYSLNDLVNEALSSYRYNNETYQDLEDYGKRLKDQGVTGETLEELLREATEDYGEESEATN